VTAVKVRRLGAWAAAAFAISLGAAALGCAAGNSVQQFTGDGGGDATLDGALGGEAGEGDGRFDVGSHHDTGGHGDATADAEHDGHVHADGDTDSGPACIAPQVKCPSGCASTSEDPHNCGTCGHVCAAGLLCSSGVCSNMCAAGQVRCTTADGGVVTIDAAVPDAAAPDAQGDAGAGMNPAGQYCADPTDDRLNCGACGNICPYGPHSTPVCSLSACSITCATGYADCDGKASNGCEVETDNNPDSCGACGVICPAVNDTANCTAGVCGIAMCNAGFANCDGNVRNGCETNTNTTQNCGGCGNMCNIANGTAGCPAGSCTVLDCNTGWGNCDNNPANGCETNTTSSIPNCGGCGSVCATANATPSCTGSKCVIGSCNPGYADCDGNPANGCEIDTQNNPSDCGACGFACSLPNAVPGCAIGKCTVASCLPGFGNCDGDPVDGCEVATGTNVNDCGSCGNVCTEANGTAGCTAGSCTITSCNAGYADCDHSPADGCEINTQNNPSDCGSCGKVCAIANGTAGCSSSACTVASCNPGFADCDGNPANGCEVNTTNDTNNCGACGKICEATCGGAADEVAAAQCVASTCSVLVCESGYIDFDGKCADGCECKESNTQDVCPGTSLFSGTLVPGNNAAPFTSTMMPVSVTQAYFTVTFGGNLDATAGLPEYHPLIILTSSNPGEFVMDVTAGCGAALSCADDATSDGVTTWEESYIGPVPAAAPNSLNPAGVSNFEPIALVAGNGVVAVRVYRKVGFTPTCGTYTINVSN